MAGIMVLGELDRGKLQGVTSELVACGRQLTEALGEEVAVALLGGDLDGASEEAISHGADRVYLVRDPLLADPHIDAHLAAFEQLCRQTDPTVVLVGKTSMGRDVAPRLAFRLDVGISQDCLEVGVDPQTKRVVTVRPVYGGSAMARITFPDTNPQIVLVRGKVYEPLAPDPSRSGQVVSVEAKLDPSVIKARWVETVRAKAEGVRMEDAKVVVGGGRGLGGPEPFKLLEELAHLLRGAVAASRAVCDAGWLDHSYQVGLTGKTITPDLYITVAISGASQHMAGCSAAKHIVAINRDADANIFSSANFGVVGDWNNVLPAFIEKVRELVES